MLNQLSKVKGNLLVASVCMICYTLTELLAPWPLKIIFDYILLGEPLPSSLFFLKGIFQRGEIFSLVIFSLSIFLIAICKGLFSYLQIYMTSRVGYQVVDILRRELFGHLQRLSLSFHNRTRSGELLTKVTSDTNILKDIFAESVLTFTAHLLSIIGMFAIMLAMSWKLTLIVLATLPILSYALFYLYGKIKASAQTQRRKEGKVASRLNEILTSVSLVQAFGREKYEKERFETESAETFEESIRTARMEAATIRTVEIISAAGLWAVVLFGSIQALQGRMSPGEVLVFIAYLNNMYKPIRNLARLSTKFVRAKVSAERISEILEIEPEIQDPPDAVEASGLKGEIVFKKVSFDYGGNRCFEEGFFFHPSGSEGRAGRRFRSR
ncbi:MAG: ABC transporter ATP-binding protein (plasmid) [Candidatus Manganitrophus sp.]|nr:ABC transporter ATP-binding protein [Candidatus Manganitrophus sp.]